MRRRAALLAIALAAAVSSSTTAGTYAAFASQLVSGSADLREAVVSFRSGSPPRAAEAALLRSFGITQGVLYQALPMAAVLATDAQLAALAANSAVRSVSLNRTFTFDNQGATAATGVDRVRSTASFTTRNGGAAVAGHGITVLINDSGVDGGHPDLRDRMSQNVAGHLNLADVMTGAPVTYQEGVTNTDAGGGHGTHVAAIAAGTGLASNGAFEGVAPAANVVGFGSGAAGAVLVNVLGGFDYALANRERFNIRVVNNSWGDTGDVCTNFNPDDPVNIATKALSDAGVVVVFSAGNSGPNPCTITGNFKKAPWVVTVANSTKLRVLSNSSSRGLKDHGGSFTAADGRTYRWEDRPTVTAPGSLIVSARAAGGTTPALSPASVVNDALGIPPENLLHYTTLSGTSMAAPHVAGIVALMLDANPALTPVQVKSILEGTADLMPGYEAWQVGAGFVNAHEAVKASFAGALTSARCTNRGPCPARVVVSVIDSGINPYHEFFYAGGELYEHQRPSSVTGEVLAAFGVDDAHTITLTRTGNFAADYAADLERVWNNIKRGEVYWFKGTNVLAVSFLPGSRPILPDDDGDTHGFGTSAAVLRANPEAVLLFVEGVDPAGEIYAFNHPEVDIVSTSYGYPGSVPLPWGSTFHLENSYAGVVTHGKLHFGAADNSPAVQFPDATAGPWWSIGVSGYQEESTEGDQVVSGSFPDFVGDFTQTLPYCADCESGGSARVSGTSFATPRSAGTMSRILLETRRALHHRGGIRVVDGVPYAAIGNDQRVTNWQMRRALEEAAHYPGTLDYSPSVGGSTYDRTSVPVLPAPWLQTGWGAITPDPARGVVEQTLAHLGIRGSVERRKDRLACEYMKPQIGVRHLYWDRVIVSESNGIVRDPYVYCAP